MMLALLLNASLAARPVTLWTEPLGPITGAVVSVAFNSRAIYLPVGVNFSIDTLEFAAELSVIEVRYLESDYTPYMEQLSAMAAFGPVLHTHKGTWFDGFFVQPKVQVQFGRTLFWPPTRLDWLGSAQLAVDVGYQLQRGHFYAAFIIGGGVGYGAAPYLVNEAMGAIWVIRSSSPRLVVSLNLNLVRLGYTF